MKKITILLMALAGLLAGANRFVTIYVQNKPFLAEIADTPEKHARGLMFRRCLKEGYGMLFVFPGEDFRSFWMKNTLIPLDMIFLNNERQIVAMHQSVSPCQADPCPGYESKVPARFVLELKGGMAKKLNLQIGDKIFLPFD